jgi:hypothetical protein
MDFVEVIKQARGILRSEGRLTYRALKRQFELDGEAKVGQTAEGLATVDEALDWAHSTGGLYYEAELYRIKGELLPAQAGKVKE